MCLWLFWRRPFVAKPMPLAAPRMQLCQQRRTWCQWRRTWCQWGRQYTWWIYPPTIVRQAGRISLSHLGGWKLEQQTECHVVFLKISGNSFYKIHQNQGMSISFAQNSELWSCLQCSPVIHCGAIRSLILRIPRHGANLTRGFSCCHLVTFLWHNFQLLSPGSWIWFFTTQNWCTRPGPIHVTQGN